MAKQKSTTTKQSTTPVAVAAPQVVAAPTPPAAPAKPAKQNLGVRVGAKTRSTYAGLVLAQTGLAVGCPPSSVAAINTAFGTVNNVESFSRLRYAHHAITAYLAANGIPVPAAKPNATLPATVPAV